MDDPRTGVRDVYDAVAPAVRAKFLSRLKQLAQLPPNDWREPLFKMLKGQEGLSEIRFKEGGVQQRPLGYRSGDFEYSLLAWATEKGDKFVPKTVCETAIERMAEAKADRSVTNAL